MSGRYRRRQERVGLPALIPSTGTHLLPEVGLPEGYDPPSAALNPPQSFVEKHTDEKLLSKDGTG